MTPQEFREARLSMGLTLTQAGQLLGYDGTHVRQQVRRMEAGEKPIRPPQARLMRAYMEGYRPEDWPKG